jgi:hypothetical protein
MSEAAPAPVEPSAEQAPKPYTRVANGLAQHHCRLCDTYSGNFLPSYVRRHVRTCNRCANLRRGARRENRATALAATLRQRERRQFGRGARSLTTPEIERLLRAADGRSAWPLWQRRRACATGRAVVLGIDKIDPAAELRLENAVVLEVAQIRARAAQKAHDPMPAPLRAAASWVAAQLAAP